MRTPSPSLGLPLLLRACGLALTVVLALAPGGARAQDTAATADTTAAPADTTSAEPATAAADTMVADATVADTAASARAPVRVTDLLKIRQLGNVTASPDGRFVAYTVKQIDATPDDERQAGARPYAYRTHLHLASTRGGEPQRLTRDPAGAADPAWHPDGDRLAFVRRVDGTPQIFVISLLGGEPYQLTDFEHGARAPRWSPDGSQLLFRSTLAAADVKAWLEAEGEPAEPAWPIERPGRTARDMTLSVPPDTFVVLRDTLAYQPLDTLSVAALGRDSIRAVADSVGAVRQTITLPAPRDDAPDPDGSLLQIRRWLARNQQQANPRVIHRQDLQGEYDLDPSPSFTHFFVADVDGEAASAPRAVTMGFASFGGGAWLPSGRQVVVTGYPRGPRDDRGRYAPPPHPDRTRKSDLYVADVASGRLRLLLRLEPYRLTTPRVTPDGSAVAFLAHDLNDPAYAQAELGLFALDGQSAPQLLTLGFDRDVGAPVWSQNGWYLYVTAPSEGSFPLYRLTPFAPDSTGAAPTPPPAEAYEREAEPAAFAFAPGLARDADLETLTEPGRGVRSFDAGATSVFYVLTDAQNPFELYVNNADFTRERRLTSHNAVWLKERVLSRPESIAVMRDDSTVIDGWVMRPPQLAEGQRAPLLLEIHGGPSAMWGPGEATMWHEFQWMAAQGFAVAYANPRGSGGYGRAFEAANYQDWGPTPAADVLAVADSAAALPWIDGARQVVTGGSYAGYLTAWIVSQTDRFEAAVAQRGVYDLPVFFGEGNAWRLVPYHYGGFPWEGPWPTDARMKAFLTDSTRATMIVPPGTERPRAERPRAERTSDDGEKEGDGEDVTRPLTPREALILNSPLTFVEQITTPLLILHADDDLRTGVVQSEALYKSLKVLGRPVEYVRYPDAGHDLSRTGDPEQRIDRLLRIYEFMARYLDPLGPVPAEAPANPQASR